MPARSEARTRHERASASESWAQREYDSCRPAATRGHGMRPLEVRYRSLLRVLPAGYRETWEEEMVATFLESMATDDPDRAGYLADFGRPSWSEVASVLALAVQLRL